MSTAEFEFPAYTLKAISVFRSTDVARPVLGALQFRWNDVGGRVLVATNSYDLAVLHAGRVVGAAGYTNAAACDRHVLLSGEAVDKAVKLAGSRGSVTVRVEPGDTPDSHKPFLCVDGAVLDAGVDADYPNALKLLEVAGRPQPVEDVSWSWERFERIGKAAKLLSKMAGIVWHGQAGGRLVGKGMWSVPAEFDNGWSLTGASVALGPRRTVEW